MLSDLQERVMLCRLQSYILTASYQEPANRFTQFLVQLMSCSVLSSKADAGLGWGQSAARCQKPQQRLGFQLCRVTAQAQTLSTEMGSLY